MARRTKIIVTVGPSCWSADVLRRLVREGADAFRVNFAHGDEGAWRRMVEAVREADEEGVRPLIGDLQGPVVRLGEVEEMEVRKGERVYVVMRERGDAEAREIPLPEALVFRQVREGDVLLIESGRVALRVEEVSSDSISCTVLVDGVIRGRKTFAIKGRDLPLPALTPRDIRAVRFAVKEDFDYVSLSFVKTGEDVERLKQLLADLGAEQVRVIAKVETRSAVENIESVVEASDAVLVARGDLAIYFDLEAMPVLQRRIASAARARGRPVIIATQLLDSMVSNPVPTRSEVIDVYTAVRDGADALLLANETAVGRYPVESVAWLSRIIERAEADAPKPPELEARTLYEAVAKAAVAIADLLGAKVIAYSSKGSTARRLAMYRPRSELHVFSSNRKVVRQMNLLWGVTPHACNFEKGDPELFGRMLAATREMGLLSYGDIAVLTAGAREGATDMIRVERVLVGP